MLHIFIKISKYTVQIEAVIFLDGLLACWWFTWACCIWTACRDDRTHCAAFAYRDALRSWEIIVFCKSPLSLVMRCVFRAANSWSLSLYHWVCVFFASRGCFVLPLILLSSCDLKVIDFIVPESCKVRELWSLDSQAEAAWSDESLFIFCVKVCTVSNWSFVIINCISACFPGHSLVA